MRKSVMMSDNEPVSKERNPEMTLEEAKADFLAPMVVEAMKSLRRDRLTRIQFIEFITQGNTRFRWTDEDEDLHIPHGFECPDPYIPDYLKKRKSYEGDFWPNGHPDDEEQKNE